MRTTCTFAFSLFLFCLIPALTLAQVYTVTDLGALAPTAINSWAQVVGNSNGHAFIWTKKGGMRDLGIMQGGTFSNGAAINDLGVISGTADGPGTVISQDPSIPNQECSDLTQPFVWTRGKGMRGLGTLGEQSSYFTIWCEIPFYGIGTNDRGQVIGNTARYGSEYQYGLFWTSAGGMSLFGGGWPPTFATKVSNTGLIVGQNAPPVYSGHATSWKNDIATDLVWLGGAAGSGYYSSSANGVNDLEQIVGWSTTAEIPSDGCWSFGSGDLTECPMHAVIWTVSGEILDLGTLPGDAFSAASRINLFGQVIGSSGNTVAFQESGFGNSPFVVVGRPFVWSEHNGLQDLNTLIHGRSGWVLNSVSDINIWGQIVGQGTLNGQPHGFLLTPRNPFKF